MSIMSAVFFMLFSALFFKRGTLDFFVLAFCSATLFFVPVFFGEVAGPPGYPDLTLSYHIYVTYWLLCFSLFFSSRIHDGFVKKASFHRVMQESFFNKGYNLKYAIFFVSIFIVLFDFQLLSFTTKREMMDEAGRSIQIAMPALTLSAIFFSLEAEKRYKAIGVVLALFSIYIGFRSYFVCYLVVVLILFYNKNFGKINIKKVFKYVLLSLPVLIFVLMSKRVYAVIKSDAGLEHIFGDSFQDIFWKGSEFFLTQYIFQSIIDSSFRLEIKNYLFSFMALLPIPQSLWGVDSSYFNEMFQSALFSDIDYGMAYNPWAEAYAYLGFMGVIMLVLFYSYTIIILQWLLVKSRNTIAPVLIVVLLFYLSFYFHRNSLAVEFSFFRNYIYLFLAGVICIKMLPGRSPRIRNENEKNNI